MLIEKRLRRACLIGLLSVSIAYTLGVSALPAQENVTDIHHTLSVELIPATHELAANDQIELQVEPQTISVTFTLAHTLHVETVAMRTQARSRMGGEIRTKSTRHKGASS